MREKRWQIERERDFSVLQDLERIQSKQKRDKTRFLNRNEFAPTSDYISQNEFRDLESNTRFRDTYRAKNHTTSRMKRYQADENANDDLKRWYDNRDMDRIERNHQVTRQIYG